MTRLPFTPKTVKKLYARSGNKCAFPECQQPLFPDDNSENISEICHIEAAEEGGQRYNPDSNDIYRRSYENLILLCPNHHKITDDESQYPVEKLKQMNQEHERKIYEVLFNENPSMITIAIQELSTMSWSDNDNDDSLDLFSIDSKINYNQIKRWKPIIDSYKIYQAKIESIYSELEQSGESFKKRKLLQIIKNLYLKKKGVYMECADSSTETELLKNHSDDILDAVEQSLIEKSNNDSDDIFITVPIIMVDAFMRCKILEKPQ